MTSKEQELQTGLRGHPIVMAMSEVERREREGLALEVGESLKTWSGGWDGESHRSEGFHRRVAFLMPEHLVREALTATRDAVERTRSGGRGLRRDASAYFAGVVKKLAGEHGIDLGLGQSGPSRERPGKTPTAPPGEGKIATEPHDIATSEKSGHEARAAIQELLQKLDAKRM